MSRPLQDSGQDPGQDPGQLPALRGRWAVPASVGGGLLLYLAFPGHDLWFLAPPGIGALLVAVSGRRPAAAFGLGLLHGVAFFAPLLSWSGIFLGPIAWVPLSLACGLSVAVAGVLLAWTSRLRPPGRGGSGGRGGAWLRALAGAGVWTAVEGAFARWPFGGFGWGRVAFSQADAPTLGLAALGGAPLVSFAVALVGTLLAQVALARPRPRHRVVSAVPLLAAALAVLLAGALVPRPSAAQDGDLAVAAVQGNVPRAGLDFNAQRRAVLDNHVQGTLDLAQQVREGRRAAPDLVLWPENSSDIDPFRNADAYAEIQAAADAVGVPLVLGAVLLGQEPGTVRNTSLVWDPDSSPTGGGAVDSYDKRHPVPFAEYIPHKSFFRHFTSAVDLVTAEFVAGDRVGRLDAAGARLGVMICFEVVEDGLVDDTVDAGADLLVVQTNNATFGYSDENLQQLAMSRLRAVEHGRAVVHVSTVGTSALVMPDGALLGATQLYTPAVVSGRVPLRTSLTPADRLRQAGLPSEALLAGLGLLGAAAGALAGRRRRAGGPGGAATAPRQDREPVA